MDVQVPEERRGEKKLQRSFILLFLCLTAVVATTGFFLLLRGSFSLFLALSLLLLGGTGAALFSVYSHLKAQATVSRKRFGQLESIGQISKNLTSVSNVRETFEKNLISTCQMFKAEKGSLMIYDPETETLTVRMAKGKDTEKILGTQQRLGEGVAGWVAKEKKPLLLKGALQSQTDFSPLVKQAGVQEALCVPLLAEGKLTGVLCLSNSEIAQGYTQQDLDLLGIIGNEIAISIDNARLYVKTEEKLQQFVHLFRLSELGLRAQSFHEKLEEMLQFMNGIIPADMYLIFLLEHERQELVVTAAVGKTRELLTQSKVSLRESFCQSAILEMEPKIYDGGHNGYSDLLIPGVATYVAYPLVSTQMILGTLGVYFFRPKSFTDEEVYILHMASNLLASAVENAHLYENIKRHYFNTVKALGNAMEARDEPTGGHSEKVARYAIRLAQEFHLREAEIEEIMVGALLHDIGKIGIPDQILLKPGKLTKEEWEVMIKHAEIGAGIAKNVDLPETVVKTILHHHHTFSDVDVFSNEPGTDRVPLYAEIIKVADAYHALISDRPYRGALTREKAIAILREETANSSHFNTKVLEAWVKIIESESDEEIFSKTDRYFKSSFEVTGLARI